jgi:methyl-accepting chemotaxis protein
MLVIGSALSARNRQQMLTGIELSHSKTALAAKMRSSMLEGGMAIRNIGLQTDLAEIDKQKLIVKNQQNAFNEARQKLTALGLNDAEKKFSIACSA